MRYKILLLPIILLEIISCNGLSAYRNNLKIAVTTDPEEGFVYQCMQLQNVATDSVMVCLLGTWDLYYTGVPIEIDKDYFCDFVYSHTVSNTPIRVSSELYDKYQYAKIMVVPYIDGIYCKYGINGVITLIKCRDLIKLSRFNEPEFNYVVFLCWRHGIYFTFDMGESAIADIHMWGNL